MSLKIKSERDFWLGAAFLLSGAAFSWGAFNYSFGTAAQPGPGYFPFGLGILLVALGAFIVFEALAVETEDGEKVGAWTFKPVALILSSVVIFGWLLPHLGLFVALPLLVVIAAAAGDEFHWGEALLNAAILTVVSWLIFSRALKLSIPLWPSFLGH
jgi:hypothetical protein